MIETAIEAGAPAGRVTLGAYKDYDTAAHVACLRELGVTPHVAQNTDGCRSAIDGRTTRHPGYAIRQRIHKRIEEPFGWLKQTADHKPVSAAASIEFLHLLDLRQKLAAALYKGGHRRVASQGRRVARAAEAVHIPLHADLSILDQRHRGLLRQVDQAQAETRRGPLRRGPRGRHA